MIAASIPTKFPIPFANSAGGSFTRQVPTASQIGITNGAASLTTGFPPNCFIPIAAGGSWPFGQDFNGLLNQVTAWIQYYTAGGPVGYDAAFSTAVGGYPKGAFLASATNGQFWVSTADNNTSDPDTGGANWLSFVTGAGGTTPWGVQGGTSGTMAANQIVLSYVAPLATTFVSGLTGSQAVLATAATASTTITLKKNGTNVGTIVFAASGTVATFTSGGVPIALAVGDILTGVAPASPDSTAATLTITLLGSVV